MQAEQVVRVWHGRVPTSTADAYLRLMQEVALPDYRSTPGNQGAFALSRTDGDITHILMLTVWQSLDHIRAFAGDPADTAKYYDFDSDFLLECEPTAVHYVVASASEGAD